MTPEQQRIAIAEACGWKVLEPEVKPAIIYLWGLREGFIHEENREIIPDYLNDLNAMQSSVQSQSERFQDDFDSALKNSGKWVASMTAQEWADIFILCLQSQRDSGNSTP